MKRLVLFLLAIAMIASLSASSWIGVEESNYLAALPNAIPDKVETVVRQCGNDPDGNFNCTETVYDDGADCLIIDNEGSPGGLFASGPDC